MATAQREWKCEPEAENALLKMLDHCIAQNPHVAKLSRDLELQTNSRLFDWVDHFICGASDQIESQLESVGFEQELSGPDFRAFWHPGAQLPRVLLRDSGKGTVGLAVKAESIADYQMVRGLCLPIEGSQLSGYRRCLVSDDNGIELWVVERRGCRQMVPVLLDAEQQLDLLDAMERWQTRPRHGNDDANIKTAIQLAEILAEQVGQDAAAWVVLEAERKYWQSRNTAGQRQKARQDHLGMGWANHDHHTFRSSRKQFQHLIRLFEVLGFHCRERFYAGEQAGWGAQVMENGNAGLVLFLDVDMSPEELEIDFAHHPLPERNSLGTIGLWCGLHGDSILQAGMHHLEAQFLFEELTEGLKNQGIGMMPAFSDFTYLKQAFTSGEQWHPLPERVEKLVRDGLITKEQGEHFLETGAVGSHLENLQRREGYKGFNQNNVSWIIKETDPRTIKT